MIMHTFNALDLGEEVSFRTKDGYNVTGRVCHIRYELGIRRRTILYQISRCEGHPSARSFWLRLSQDGAVVYHRRAYETTEG